MSRRVMRGLSETCSTLKSLYLSCDDVAGLKAVEKAMRWFSGESVLFTCAMYVTRNPGLI